jgi:hypothetical protein
MPRGGARTGAGRKSVADEEKTRSKAKAAITEKYGSIEDGLKALLGSGEQSLIKFVFEHALGKPADDIDITTNGKDITSKEIVFRDYGKPPVQ